MSTTETRTAEPRTSIATDEVALLERYHRDGDLQARTMLIERMMPLVRHIARRYANRGEPLDDLVQVGAVGLIKAVDRFDPERGVQRSPFAAPNIAGVRVPVFVFCKLTWYELSSGSAPANVWSAPCANP